MPSPSQTRTVLYPLAAAVVVLALWQLRPSGGDAREPDRRPLRDAPEVEREFRFLRPIPLPQPPHVNFIEDPAERWYDRILWAPGHILDYTRNLVPRLDAYGRRRFVELVDEHWKRDPVRTHLFFTAIGQLGDVPRAVEILIEATRNGSNLVRSEAARGLKLLNTAQAARQIETLLYDTSSQVRRAATQALIEMDDVPESLEALKRYADGGGEEGIRHVLYRIGRNTDDPSAIPILRKHLAAGGAAHYIALEALCRFGDPNAIDELYKLLDNPDLTEQQRGLGYLLNAPTDLIDPDRVEPLLRSQNAMVRRTATQVLLQMARNGDIDDKDRFAQILLEQTNDRDVQVSQLALAAVYAIGRKDIAEAYVRQIPRATGSVLHNNVDVATQLLGDQRALPAIRERLESDPDLDPRDASILITGVGRLGDPSGRDLLLRFILDAGPDEPLDASGLALSARAAQSLPELGSEVIDDLLSILERDQRAEVHLRAIDALRGFPKLDCLELLLDIASDPERDARVRKAALETLPLCKDRDLFEPLMQTLPNIENFEVAQTAQYVLMDYS